MANPEVFISSSTQGLEIARALGDHLASTATVTIWSESFSLGQSAVESLSEAADRSDFAVFIMTPEDASQDQHLHSNLTFELGFLAGRLGMSRTFIIVANPASVRLPTDLAGIMYLGLSETYREDVRVAVTPAARAIQRAMSEMEVKRQQQGDFHSCFISYSWRDQDFAIRLHDDLQNIGVRCWLDVKEMRAGDRLADQITKAVQEHDKVLLVLSQHSVGSAWVRTEVTHALKLERERQKTVLYPISLDDALFAVVDWPEATRLKEKYIVDFNEWHDSTLYRKAFQKLVRDLAISASIESGRAS